MKLNYLSRLPVLVLFLLSSLVATAQEGPNRDQMGGGKDPMREFLFPPELVMRYQNEIQLNQEQKEAIIAAAEESQKKFTRLQWNLQSEMATFQKLMSESKVNEQKALEQLDKVLDAERQVKKTQITLMLRIKNALTDEQKTKLNGLKGKG